MSLYSYFRISKPSPEKVPAEQVDEEYKRLRTKTFWGVTTAYIFYYVCRMTLGVVQQPIIHGGVLSAAELGVIGSVFYFVYAAGKFTNGFIADYCNIRRFMAWGLGVSAVINLVLGRVAAAEVTGNPDLDGSGTVDIVDVNALINLILQ
jgi:OPA family sugar phosphate sensor protein UhpC-like MFS transporter